MPPPVGAPPLPPAQPASQSARIPSQDLDQITGKGSTRRRNSLSSEDLRRKLSCRHNVQKRPGLNPPLSAIAACKSLLSRALPLVLLSSAPRVLRGGRESLQITPLQARMASSGGKGPASTARLPIWRVFRVFGTFQFAIRRFLHYTVLVPPQGRGLGRSCREEPRPSPGCG